MSILRRIRRHFALQEMGDRTLAVVASLERAGCRVQAAHILPMARVHIDAPPAGLHTCGWEAPPWHDPHLPVLHAAHIDGVRITWHAPASTAPRAGVPAILGHTPATRSTAGGRHV